MIKVALIIVHFKGIKDTLECIRSLEEVNFKNIKFHIYLIDNSSENIKNQIKSFLSLKYIKSPYNVGFAEGNNIGIRLAIKEDYEFIFLLNNDTIVSQDFLTSLIDFAKDKEDLGIVSPKIYFAPGFEYHKDRYKKADQGKVIWYAGGKIDWENIYASHIGVDEVDQGQYDKAKEIDFATGCCMLIKRDVLEKVGLFDKNYFVYFEDVDLSTRAKKAGFKVYYTPNTFLWHKNASSSGKPGSSLHVYYQTRNRLYFGLKYAHIKTKIHLIRDALFMTFGGNPAQKKACLDFFTNKMGKGSYNLN